MGYKTHIYNKIWVRRGVFYKKFGEAGVFGCEKRLVAEKCGFLIVLSGPMS